MHLIDDDMGSEDEDAHPPKHDKHAPDTTYLTEAPADTRQQEFGDLSDSGEESEDDFIVDDEGQPIVDKKKKRPKIHDNAWVFVKGGGRRKGECGRKRSFG